MHRPKLIVLSPVLIKYHDLKKTIPRLMFLKLKLFKASCKVSVCVYYCVQH